MKRFKKMMAIAIVAVMTMTMSSAMVFAASHTVSTGSTTHTYEVYQIFTGEKSGDQLTNLKYGTNAKTGTAGASVSASDMEKLAQIEDKTYDTDQEKIADLSQFVNLTNPVATLGKDGNASASLAEGYYIIKDKDNSLEDPEGYTLYLFKVLDDNLDIEPKDGTTVVDKDVTETNDTTATTTAEQKGADYDEGDSIPYSIDITLAANVTDYTTYTVTLTDTLSTGLTPPAQADVDVTFKDSTGANITAFGQPTVTVNGQVITVTYTIKGDDSDSKVAVGKRTGSNVLNGAVINVSYDAILNDQAKSGVEGNPNTYTITYSNNPNNSEDKNTTPSQEVKVFTYELDIEKVDGNSAPLEGAGFTLYKKVAGTPVTSGSTTSTVYPTGAQKGSDIKQSLTNGVDASKLDNNSYYIAVGMTESTANGKVTHHTNKKIDAGEYVLVETTVPAGYNAYAGENITLTSTIDSDGNLTGLTATPASLTVAADKSGASGTVVNNSGATLPSTGGIGTTLFYLIGAILIIGAGVVLVTRRRVDSAE